MSSPVVWIIFPMLAAVILWFFEHKPTITMIASMAVCIFLAVLAFFLPIDTQINLGGITFQLDPSLDLLGRRLILEDANRPILMFIYGLSAFWFLGAYFSFNHRYFWPLGLLVVSLLAAVLAVQPFFYSALIIEVVVLVSIPILYPPGTRIGQGGLRFLIYQSLAIPIFLFAGWFAAGVDANPGSESLVLAAVAFLGLGIAFWLAIFPFYTWVPLLLEETHIYSGSFIVNTLSIICLLTLLNFINSFDWLRTYPFLADFLHLVGGIMVFSAGAWAIFEKKLSRLLAYSIIMETGTSLMALSLLNVDGYHLFLSLLLPRAVAVGVWTICLSVLFEKGLININDISGLFYLNPLLTINLLIAYLTIGGFPLLAVFPLRYILYENLAKQSMIMVLWLFAGHILFLITGFRLIYQVFIFKKVELKIEEKLPVVILSSIGTLFLIALGIFPNWTINIMAELLKSYPKLIY